MNTEFFIPLQIFVDIFTLPLIILGPMTVFRALILSND